MRVSYTAMGGLVPLFQGCTLDTDLLTPAEAKELVALVEQSGIASLGNRRIPNAADVRTITITVESDGASSSTVLDLPLVPAGAMPLVAFLQRRSRNLLPDPE